MPPASRAVYNNVSATHVKRMYIFTCMLSAAPRSHPFKAKLAACGVRAGCMVVFSNA